MGRVYVIDAYNFVLQDNRLDRLVAERGLEEGRRAFRSEAENLARRAGCRIRLIYDGARGPFEHVDQFENQFVEASFTSTGEKADERVVAVALEMARRGDRIWVVSDDEEGVRRPLRASTVTLMGTREFARLLRERPEGDAVERRADAISGPDRAALARDFLSRDAAPGAGSESDDARWSEIPRVEPPPAPVRAERTPAPAPRIPVRAAAPAPPTPPRPPVSARPAGPVAPDPAERAKARKERGARKQERRLSLLQSSTKSKSNRKPKR